MVRADRLLRLVAVKLHRLRVTRADATRPTGATIDSEMLVAAGITPFEEVEIVNLTNGSRWSTCAMAGAAGRRGVCLDGQDAQRCGVGDVIEVWVHTQRPRAAVREMGHSPRIFAADEHNVLVELPGADSDARAAGDSAQVEAESRAATDAAPLIPVPSREAFTTHGLTAAERAEFESTGILALPGALPPDRLERMKRTAVQRHRRALAAGEVGPDTRFDTSHVLDMGDDFLALVAHQQVLPKVVDLLGSNIFLYHTQFNALPSTTQRSEPNTFSWHWHQDNEVLISDTMSTASPRFNLKVVYLLTDLTSGDRGSTWYVPGSQYADRRPPVDPERPHRLIGARPLLGKAGTAILMDTRLWHCGTPNSSDVTRLAVWMGYGFRWLRLYADHGDLEVFRDRCDPVMAQLLDLAGTEQYEPAYVSDRYTFSAAGLLPLARLIGSHRQDPHEPAV